MREDRDHQPDRALGQQLGGDARAHHLDAPVVDLVAERAAHLGDRRLLRLVAAGLLRDADEHVGRGAELLELGFAEAEPVDGAAHLGEVGGSRLRLHLDQRAADEIDAEIQAVKEVQHDGDDRQRGRDRKAHAPEAHEIELGVVRDDSEQAHGCSFCCRPVQIGTVCGRCQRTQ